MPGPRRRQRCRPRRSATIATVNRSSLVLAVICAALAVSAVAGQSAASYDLLIRNGRVLDGSGNPWFPADVAVKDGRIVAVGRLEGRAATTVIDATGKYVTPGFIDIHSHADDGSSPRRRAARPDPGPACGAEPRLAGHHHRCRQPGRPLAVADSRSAARCSRSSGIGINAMLLVGHGTVRRMVMGDDVQRPATAAEIRRACASCVRQGLQEGAVGLSAGLEYEPGRWSTTDEVVELARELPAVRRHLHLARAQRRQRSAVVRAEPGRARRRRRCSTRSARPSRSARRPAPASSPRT